jgi:hypothetical protein
MSDLLKSVAYDICTNFKYHKIPIVGKILKPTSTSVDVPSFSYDEIGLIVDEDDITIYQGNKTIYL